MNARVVWAKGGEAHVVSITADAIVLRSTVPWPPGSRIEGTIDVQTARLALRVKVHSSRRVGDQEFLLNGRPIDLTREARERVQACTEAPKG